MALAKEKEGRTRFFGYTPLCMNFIVYILFYHYTLLKAVEKASITYSFTPNNNSP